MAYEIKYRSDNEMKDSGIEWLEKIPRDWNKLNIGNIGYLGTSSVDKKIVETEEEVFLLNYLDIYNNKSKTITNDINFMKVTARKSQIKASQIKRGDVYFTPSSETSDDIGHSAVVIEDIENTLFSYHLMRLSFNKCIDNQFKKYLFNNYFVLKQFSKKANGTTRKTLTKDDFKYTNVLLPPISDQQKIANFLDIKIAEFDSIISKKELLIEKLEEAKKSLISEVVTGKVKIVDGELVDRKPEEMKDSGVEWLGTIPKDWEVKKIKHNTYVKGRIGWQGLRADEFTDEGPYLVTGTDFLNKSINWNNCYHISEKRYKEAPAIHLKDGDLLITKDGSIGKLAIVENCPDKAILNSGIFVTRCTNGEYLTEFMFYILSSNIFNIYIGLMTTGSTILHLYQSTFVNFIYPLPNIDIQSKLIQYLDNETNKINSIITKTQEQITKLKEAKQSLISEAVTGKIDLRDWEIIETGGR